MATLDMPDYTTKEAARLLGIHDKYIFQMHKQGRIRFTLDCTGRYRVPMGEVYRREKAILGKVFEMDKWLDEPNNRAGGLHWRRVLRERDEALEQLRFNRTLIEAHKEANQHR